MKSDRYLYFLTAFVLIMSGGHIASAAVRTVALTGQQVPGMASGVTFTGFSDPVISAVGRVAFSGGIEGSGVTVLNHGGIWSESLGVFTLVARSGSPAPGTASGITYRTFGNPMLNAAGQTAFYALLTGSGVDETNNRGIWSEGSGTLSLVAREGMQAPGTGNNFSFGAAFDVLPYAYPAFNAAGQTAFYAELSGSGVNDTNNQGLWSERSGTLKLVARSGNHAPGTPSGVNYSGFYTSPFPPVLDGTGGAAFYAGLIGSGVDDTNNRGIWSERSGSLELIARSGMQASSMTSGVQYASFYSTVVNAHGEIAFGALLTGSGDPLFNRGIWTERSGTLELVARSDSQAPGTVSGINYDVLLSPVLNDAGRTAFVSTLSGSGVDTTNDSGLWSEGSGTLELVARKGDHAPGTPEGVKFGSSQSLVYAPFSSPVLNATGQVAFRGYLTGSGINDANDQGIWATDPSGVLQLIAREGDAIEVAPGDFRTVNLLRFQSSSGNGDGRASGFSDLSQVAFGAWFTDGSRGIFVATPTANHAGDFDLDGDVDGRDFLWWQRNPNVGNLADWLTNYGNGALAGVVDDPARWTAVPEPSSFVVAVALAMIALMAFHLPRRSVTKECGPGVSSPKLLNPRLMAAITS